MAAKQSPMLLYAKAIVFDDGETQAAIITNDLIGVEAIFVDQVRQTIEGTTGIPAGNVMISCSHTHFGPEVRASRATVPQIIPRIAFTLTCLHSSLRR